MSSGGFEGFGLVEGAPSLEKARCMATYMLSMMRQANAVASIGDPFILKTYFWSGEVGKFEQIWGLNARKLR